MSHEPTDHGRNAGPDGHLDARRIEAYLDGELPEGERSAVVAHADACARCGADLESWKLLFARLEALPEFEPGAGFAAAVLDRVRRPRTVPAMETARWAAEWLRDAGRRAAAWSRRLAPATRRGWAAASAVALAPAAAVGFLAYWLLSSPLVTPAALAAYLGARLRDGAVVLVGRVGDFLLESPVVYRAYSIGEALFRTPESALLAGLVFTTLAAAAAWVLYRNLFTARTVDVTHAHYSF